MRWQCHSSGAPHGRATQAVLGSSSRKGCPDSRNSGARSPHLMEDLEALQAQLAGAFAQRSAARLSERNVVELARPPPPRSAQRASHACRETRARAFCSADQQAQEPRPHTRGQPALYDRRPLLRYQGAAARALARRLSPSGSRCGLALLRCRNVGQWVLRVPWRRAGTARARHQAPTKRRRRPRCGAFPRSPQAPPPLGPRRDAPPYAGDRPAASAGR